MMNDPERDDDPQEVFQAPDGSTWYPHRGYWCWKTATTLAERDATLAERDATLAALRAMMVDLLPMLDADAMTISDQQAEIDRLSHRAYELAVAIMGGEDAPGYADSVDTETLVEQMRQSRRDANRADDRAARAACEADCRERMRAAGWVPAGEALARPEAVGVMAALTAAISLLERSPKTAAPSNKMFDMMLTDYRRALDNAREALATPPAEPATPGGQHDDP